MLISKSKLRQIIREELLKEQSLSDYARDVAPGAYGRTHARSYTPGGGREIEKRDERLRDPRSTNSVSPASIARLILGFTPVGLAYDAYDMFKALVDRDAAMFALATVGFIPGIGDLKGLTRSDLDDVAQELGPDGMRTLKNRADAAQATGQAASRASRTARISEPVIETLDDGSLLKAKYTVDIDDMSYDVIFARKSHDAPIDISFNVSGFTRYVTTDAGHPLSLVSGVMDTFKDLHRRYPDEKSFQFTGFISKKDRSNFEMGGDQVSKRTKAFKALIQRALRRDSSIEVEKISDLGWAGDPNTIKITLKELRRIIKESMFNL